jgi:hypothetical protein
MTLHAMTLLVQHRLEAEIEALADTVPLHVLPPPCHLAVQPIDFSRADELIDRSLADAKAFLDVHRSGRALDSDAEGRDREEQAPRTPAPRERVARPGGLGRAWSSGDVHVRVDPRREPNALCAWLHRDESVVKRDRWDASPRLDVSASATGRMG